MVNRHFGWENLRLTKNCYFQLKSSVQTLSNCIKKVNGSTETPQGEESNHYAEIFHLLYRLTTSFCQTCLVKLFFRRSRSCSSECDRRLSSVHAQILEQARMNLDDEARALTHVWLPSIVVNSDVTHWQESKEIREASQRRCSKTSNMNIKTRVCI